MSNISIVDQLREMRLTAMARGTAHTLILGILRMNVEQSCRSLKPDVMFSSLRKNLIKALA